MKFQLILFVFACAVTEIWACPSCGISSGGPMVQIVSKKFEWIDGLDWELIEEIIVFVDRYNYSINGYHMNTGRVRTIKIDEFKDQELSAIFPIKQEEIDEESGKLKYVIAANQSLYKFEGKFGEPYTLEKIMDITDESHYLSKAAIDKKGHLVIGTFPTDFNHVTNTENFKKGSAKYYYVNLSDKSKKVIDKDLDIAGGVCFNKYYNKMYSIDSYKNKLYSYEFNVEDGKASDKKEIFDLTEYNKTMKADIYGKMASVVMDMEDNLWIGFLYSYEILVFNLFEHKIVKRIDVPAAIQSAVAWGGPKFDILFVGTSKRPPPGLGSLIAISNTGHRGWPSHEIEM